ncbi:MAG TPA: UDP-N-acetylglucosamine diphosphorylase/glucosamine-1-phosphate N-acetyltransferase [Gammaproteobacteria bacterium]|nr:UDP-N-acetylglucosamine diphosphorylase/glucosamine-1-phosphate N-acetyltransferase [Gammaproteobacteria bacterium]
MALSIIILAAGQGTRMCSALPKVLHEIAGKPLLEHVVETAAHLPGAQINVVYGHGGKLVPERLAHLAVNWVEQADQLGTGHAVMQAMPAVASADKVLVLYGDVPLIRAETLDRLLKVDGVALLTVSLEDATGYGRIERDQQGHICRIIEHKDASEQQKQIQEINTGIMACSAQQMSMWLERLDNNNSQGEYYLTDLIEMAVADGVEVISVAAQSEAEVLGINDRVQLAALERVYQQEQAQALMRAGVTVMDPSRLDIRGVVTTGQDVVLDINVILEGKVVLGEGIQVGANTSIRNCKIGDGVIIKQHCVLEDAEIGNDATIGPFARIRPEARLSEGVHIGNFVEIKKSIVGKGSKINHLSYIGDSEIGCDVNIGAGTITCNYDGAYKHKTIIGDNAFIGSDTQLVAPVTVGKGATIGAGSTITSDTPDNELSLSRSKQISLKGWRRPVKKPTENK